jgi:hypothetical protein
MCLVYSQWDALLKIIEIWPPQEIYKKMKVFPKKKYMFSILKLKNAKNSYGGYPIDNFLPDWQKFQAAPQLLENILEYNKENKIKSKLILIYTVSNKK